MNDRERKLMESCITEAKQQREDALNKAKAALEEAFPERNVTIIKKVAEEGVTTGDLDEMIDELASGDNSVSGSAESENTQPSFYQSLSPSFDRKKINERTNFKNRLRLLAGIKTSPAVARLTIKEGVSVDLLEIPKWYDVIRYKLCGFKYEVLVEQL
jgi:hypothetical protein